MKKIHIIICCVIMTLIPISVTPQQSSDTLTLVNVPFRAIERDNLLGGVSVINVEDLMTRGYIRYTSAYLDAVMVGGVNGMNIWGMGPSAGTGPAPLIIVDGIPRDHNNVHPSEIASITVLRSAAAVVLYGSRAINGAIVITTKRGQVEDLRIRVRANTGFFVPISFPNFLGAAEYMTLHNEARRNDGLSDLFSAEQIFNHGSGLNPYRFPDFNFFTSDFIRPAFNRSEAIVEVTGGTDRARFYTTTGYSRDGSLLRVGNAANNNTTRFFVRGNVDVNVTDLISVRTDANVSFFDVTTAAGDFWGQSATMRPHLFNPLIPISFVEENDRPSLALLGASRHIINGTHFLGGTLEHQTNAIADAFAGGTGAWISRQFQFNTGIDFNLRGVMDGLFFRTTFGLDYATTYNQRFNEEYRIFVPTWTNYAGRDMIASLGHHRDDRRTGNQTISDATYRTTMFFSGQFDFNRTIDNQHNIFAMLVANGWQRTHSLVYHRVSSANLGVQLSYNFRNTYFIDFTGNALHSARLPEHNRRAFSPTASLGWRLTNEAFMDNQSLFDNLMLTASAGIMHSDLNIFFGDVGGNAAQNAAGNAALGGNAFFLYEKRLANANWWSWGDNSGEPAVAFQRGANPHLRFIERREVTLGLRGSMLNRRLQFETNAFLNRVDGGVIRPDNMFPSYFTLWMGTLMPIINYNIDERRGVDFSVNFNQNVSEVFFSLGVNGMFQDNRAIRRSELFSFDHQTRMGRPISSIFGLQSMGFFQTEEEIAAAPRQAWGDVQPGDLRYISQTGRDVIDGQDEVFLGRWDSPVVLGTNATVRWRNFTLFAMGTGHFGGHGLKNNLNWWSGRGTNKYTDVVRNRWAYQPEHGIDTRATATMPRLTSQAGDNNFRTSDFWLFSTNRFNLRQVQLTFDFPEHMFSGSGVQGLSLYVSGSNLLTIAKEREHMELNIGSAPQNRFYNIGLQVTF